MLWNQIVSAVCIYVSALVYSFSLLAKTKAKLLSMQLVSGSLYVLNYIFTLISLPTVLIGTITAAFETLRTLIFFFVEKNDKFNTSKNNYIVSAIFLAILTVCTVLSWSGWISILPLIGAYAVTLALATKNILLIKIVTVVQTTLVIVYLCLLNLWLNAGSQIIIIVLGVVGVINAIRKNKIIAKQNNNLPTQS